MRSRLVAGVVLAGVLLAGATAGAGETWLGLGAGQVKPEGVNATVNLAGELRLELGEHFALQPDIGYWQRSETVSGVSVKASDFSFGMTALVLLPAGPVRFFAGAGPAIHRIGGDVDYFGFSVASDSLTRIGLGVLGGLDVEISRSVAFFVAARYDWVPLETDAPDSIDQRRVYGGFRLRL
ncbi:MAG TPA: outer membrane beta-barrel protein [Vicinamibacteria bacterium]